MSGSFWKFSNGFTSMSNITSILEAHNEKEVDQDDDSLTGEEVISKSNEVWKTLEKLFDENDLLQELLSNNSVLLEFLRDDDVLKFLFDLVINQGLEKDIVKEMDKLHVAEKEASGDAEESDTSEKPQEGDEAMDSDSKDDKDSDDEEPTEFPETEEEKLSRYASLATEVLSADVWSLTDTVMESTENLNKLWAVLDSNEPLSINLSSCFMKINEHLLDMKCDEMINYLIDNQPNLINKFINHLSNPPLMDFLLKLISTDKPDNSTGIIDFLQNQKLIPLLVDALDQTDEPDSLIVQSSAADLLKALITISANSTTDNSTIGPNELTRELVSTEMMEKLCNIMLKGSHALSNGVGIIIEIIRKNNSDYDILPILYITLESHPPTGRDPIYLGYLLKVFSESISKFNDILINENDVEVLKTSFGEIKPLGFEKFKICELIAELLHCSNMSLLNDNKGFDIVKERNELREKMKAHDPISFKYNEVIVLPDQKPNEEEFDEFNDTIDSFNSKNEDSILHNQVYEDDQPHENANLTEEQIRGNPVIGDLWKISIYDAQIINNILNMFFKFPWNNFLHNVVFDIVQQVLNGSMDIGFNKFLAIDLFHKGDITNKIIYGQELCAKYEQENNGLRLGYMGHLTLIAEEVVKFIQSYPNNTLSELIDAKISDAKWEDYVSNILFDTRKKYNAILGGGDEDDDEDEDENMSNTFDEGTGEIIEESDYKAGFLFDNDEEEEEESKDDDDHFSNYMTQELVNTATTEEKNSDDETSSEDDEIKYEDDDYEDPNDDGHSYKKNNLLYDDSGSLIQKDEDDDSTDSEEEEEVEEKHTLTRAASHNE